LAQRDGVIVRINEQGLGIVEETESHERFAFSFDKINGYRGESPKEMGLKAGALVRFDSSPEDGITSVELNGQIG
jgi:hypothetical protein